MKNLLLKITIHLLATVWQWFSTNPKLEQLITKYYQQIRNKDGFVTHIETIYVKKGSKKYTLIVIETPKGKIKYNLGRYHANFEGEDVPFDLMLNLSI